MRIDRVSLLPLAQHASEIADKGTGVTACVRLAAIADRLTVQATNYDRSGDAWATADGDGDWSVCVNAAQFARLVGAMVDGATVALRLDPGDRLAVEAGRSRYALAGVPASEFPDIPELGDPGDPQGVPVDSAELRRLLDRTAYCVSRDDNRPAIAGLYLAAKDDTLTAVATDGPRLALATCPAPGLAVEAILHRAALSSLRRLLDASPVVWVARVGRSLSFACHGRRLFARVVEANFPDYTKVLPDPTAGSVVQVDAAALAAELDRVAPMLPGRDAILRLTLDCADGGTLALDAFSDGGQAHAELGVDWTGAGATYGMNPAFLREAAKSLGGTLALRFVDQFSPVLVTSDAAAGASAAIMPMRL